MSSTSMRKMQFLKMETPIDQELLNSIHSEFEKEKQNYGMFQRDFEDRCESITPNKALDFYAKAAETYVLNAHKDILSQYHEMLKKLISLLSADEHYIDSFSAFGVHVMNVARNDLQSDYKFRVQKLFSNILKRSYGDSEIKRFSEGIHTLEQNSRDESEDFIEAFNEFISEINQVVHRYFLRVDQLDQQTSNPLLQQVYNVTRSLESIIESMTDASTFRAQPDNTNGKHDRIVENLNYVYKIALNLIEYITDKAELHKKDCSIVNDILYFTDEVKVFENIVSDLSFMWLDSVLMTRVDLSQYLDDVLFSTGKYNDLIISVEKRRKHDFLINAIDKTIADMKEGEEESSRSFKERVIEKMGRKYLIANPKKSCFDLSSRVLVTILVSAYSQLEKFKDIVKHFKEESEFNEKILDRISPKKKIKYEIEKGLYDSKKNKALINSRNPFYKPESQMTKTEEELIKNYLTPKDTYKSYESQSMLKDRFFSTYRKQKKDEMDERMGIESNSPISTAHFVLGMEQQERLKKMKNMPSFGTFGTFGQK